MEIIETVLKNIYSASDQYRILNDPEFTGAIENEIKDSKINAEGSKSSSSFGGFPNLNFFGIDF